MALPARSEVTLRPLGKSTVRPHPSIIGSLLGKLAAERPRRLFCDKRHAPNCLWPTRAPRPPARGAPGRCRGDDVAEEAQKVHVPEAIRSVGDHFYMPECAGRLAARDSVNVRAQSPSGDKYVHRFAVAAHLQHAVEPRTVRFRRVPVDKPVTTDEYGVAILDFCRRRSSGRINDRKSLGKNKPRRIKRPPTISVMLATSATGRKWLGRNPPE